MANSGHISLIRLNQLSMVVFVNMWKLSMMFINTIFVVMISSRMFYLHFEIADCY